MNILFRENGKRKRSRCDNIIHKYIIISVDINQKNKSFSVTFQPKKACKLEFVEHF